MKRVYISGPITGIENYKELFGNAENKIKYMGYEVINPARIEFDCLSWDEYMKVDLELLEMCDAVVMLEGWKNSPGACVERGYALGTDKMVFNSLTEFFSKMESYERSNIMTGL